MYFRKSKAFRRQRFIFRMFLKTWNSEEAQVYHNISTIDSNVAKYMNQYESLLKREEDIFEEGGTERLKETVNGINVATSVIEKNISFQHKKKRLQIMHVFVIRFERWQGFCRACEPGRGNDRVE